MAPEPPNVGEDILVPLPGGDPVQAKLVDTGPHPNGLVHQYEVPPPPVRLHVGLAPPHGDDVQRLAQAVAFNLQGPEGLEGRP